MKYRLLAIFMVCVYLFSSVSVFASQVSSSETVQETVTSESDTTDSTDNTNDNPRNRYFQEELLEVLKYYKKNKVLVLK